MPRPARTAASQRRAPTPWDVEEERRLSLGMAKYGHLKNKWALILKHFGGFAPGRTNVDLKDKWRVMQSAREARPLLRAHAHKTTANSEFDFLGDELAHKPKPPVAKPNPAALAASTRRAKLIKAQNYHDDMKNIRRILTFSPQGHSVRSLASPSSSTPVAGVTLVTGADTSTRTATGTGSDAASGVYRTPGWAAAHAAWFDDSVDFNPYYDTPTKASLSETAGSTAHANSNVGPPGFATGVERNLDVSPPPSPLATSAAPPAKRARHEEGSELTVSPVPAPQILSKGTGAEEANYAEEATDAQEVHLKHMYIARSVDTPVAGAGSSATSPSVSIVGSKRVADSAWCQLRQRLQEALPAAYVIDSMPSGLCLRLDPSSEAHVLVPSTVSSLVQEFADANGIHVYDFELWDSQSNDSIGEEVAPLPAQAAGGPSALESATDSLIQIVLRDLEIFKSDLHARFGTRASAQGQEDDLSCDLSESSAASDVDADAPAPETAGGSPPSHARAGGGASGALIQHLEMLGDHLEARMQACPVKAMAAVFRAVLQDAQHGVPTAASVARTIVSVLLRVWRHAEADSARSFWPANDWVFMRGLIRSAQRGEGNAVVTQTFAHVLSYANEMFYADLAEIVANRVTDRVPLVYLLYGPAQDQDTGENGSSIQRAERIVQFTLDLLAVPEASNDNGLLRTTLAKMLGLAISAGVCASDVDFSSTIVSRLTEESAHQTLGGCGTDLAVLVATFCPEVSHRKTGPRSFKVAHPESLLRL